HQRNGTAESRTARIRVALPPARSVHEATEYGPAHRRVRGDRGEGSSGCGTRRGELQHGPVDARGGAVYRRRLCAGVAEASTRRADAIDRAARRKGEEDLRDGIRA